MNCWTWICLLSWLAAMAPVSGRADCGTLNQNDVYRRVDGELGIDGIKKLFDGLKVHFAIKPEVQKILTDTTQSAAVIEYLICRAREEQVIAQTPEAAECLRRQLHFMST